MVISKNVQHVLLWIYKLEQKKTNTNIRLLNTKTLAILNAETPEFSLITSGNENCY